MIERDVMPTAINIDKQRRVVVIPWSDGTTCEYGFDGLRASCPCAECAGGHANMGQPPDPTVFDRPDLPHHDVVGAELVGNYALQLNWSDGHRAGIYHWAFLRGLCPKG